jgi:hypothetical protein
MSDRLGVREETTARGRPLLCRDRDGARLLHACRQGADGIDIAVLHGVCSA